MDVGASLGNNDHKNNLEDRENRWEQLIGRGAFYCGRCDQAWLLISADEAAAHFCKNCGDPLARLIKGRPVTRQSGPRNGEQLDRRIA